MMASAQRDSPEMMHATDANTTPQNQASAKHKVLVVDDVVEVAGIVEDLQNALPIELAVLKRPCNVCGKTHSCPP